MDLIRKDTSSLSKELRNADRRNKIIEFVESAVTKKLKEKEESFVTNLTNKEYLKLKKDLSDAEMTCDDSCRDMDQEITSKDCIIKCKEDEIKKMERRNCQAAQ